MGGKCGGFAVGGDLHQNRKSCLTSSKIKCVESGPSNAIADFFILQSKRWERVRLYRNFRSVA